MTYLYILLGIQIVLTIAILIYFIIKSRNSDNYRSQLSQVYAPPYSDNILPIPPALVIIANGRNKGQSYQINKISTIIGRDDLENDIALDDTFITKTHAQIIYTEKGFVIYDRNSKNGIYVNGKRTLVQKLNNGDKIGIGKTTLIFRIVD